ncbi:putative inorganic phosphate cotransporter [Armadillidium vulgare]|nr:putative inorganic phosphate cotransporter [Armadillidium vulgare]
MSSKDTEKNVKEMKKECPKCEMVDAKDYKLGLWGARHTLSLMLFLAFSCDYALRVNLSVAIVAMVNDTSSSTDNTSTSDQCPYPDDQNNDDHYGGSIVGGIGITLTGVLTLISPWAAGVSSKFFILINNIIPKWYPKKERSKFSAFFFSGMQFGTVVSMMLSGYLCSTDFLGGWPSAFYVIGFLTVIWGVLWFILIKDNPQDHPRISKEELRYITDGCPILKNGLYTALPYIGGWIFSNVFGYFSDILLKKNILTLVQVRRWAMVAALYGPMVCLIGMCFVDCNSTAAVAILFLGGTLNGAMFCGYMCSHADISPRFSASLMGITNTIATIPGFVSPAITGAITNAN